MIRTHRAQFVFSVLFISLFAMVGVAQGQEGLDELPRHGEDQGTGSGGPSFFGVWLVLSLMVIPFVIHAGGKLDEEGKVPGPVFLGVSLFISFILTHLLLRVLS